MLRAAEIPAQGVPATEGDAAAARQPVAGGVPSIVGGVVGGVVGTALVAAAALFVVKRRWEWDAS
jgi:hypothetical protein